MARPGRADRVAAEQRRASAEAAAPVELARAGQRTLANSAAARSAATSATGLARGA